MSFGRLLGEALAMGKKYPIIYVPILAVTVLVSIIMAISFGRVGAMPPGMGFGYAEGVMTNLWAHLIWAFVGGVLIIAGHAVTVLMVGQVLKEGTPSLRQGIEQARLRLIPLLLAAALTALIAGIGFVFFILPGLIVVFFLLFTFVAVAVDQYPAMGGIRKSFVIVKDRLGDAFVFFLLLIALGVLFTLVNRILLFIPVIGAILSMVISGLYSGYVSTLVVLGYRELSPGGLAGPEPGAPSAGPSPGGVAEPGTGPSTRGGGSTTPPTGANGPVSESGSESGGTSAEEKPKSRSRKKQSGDTKSSDKNEPPQQ